MSERFYEVYNGIQKDEALAGSAIFLTCYVKRVDLYPLFWISSSCVDFTPQTGNEIIISLYALTAWASNNL